MLTHFTACFDVRRPDLDYAMLRRVLGQWRKYAECYFGDYYPLTPYSLDTTSWIAWHFHRADLDEGVVQAFRRPEATSGTLLVKLRGLDPQRRYEIENFDGGKEVKPGAELMGGYVISLPERPAAALLRVSAVK